MGKSLKKIAKKHGFELKDKDFWSPPSPWVGRGRLRKLIFEKDGKKVVVDSKINNKGHPEYFIKLDDKKVTKSFDSILDNFPDLFESKILEAKSKLKEEVV